MREKSTQQLFPESEAVLIDQLANQTHPQLVEDAQLKLKDLAKKHEKQMHPSTELVRGRHAIRASGLYYGGVIVVGSVLAGMPEAIPLGVMLTGLNEANLFRMNKPVRIAKARVTRLEAHIAALATDTIEMHQEEMS